MKVTGLVLLMLVASIACDTPASSTATAAPTTQTPSPSTTSAPVTSSEPPKTTTSTEKPSPAPTPEPTPTPTPAPAPTPAPTPEPHVLPSTDSKFPEPVSFNVTVKGRTNETCLDVKMAAQFVLVNESEYLNLANASVVDPVPCNNENDTQVTLKLTFGGNNVSFVFKRSDDLSSAWLDTIHLSYHVVNETEPKHFDLTEKLFESNGTAGHGKAYHCRAQTESSANDGMKVLFKEVETKMGTTTTTDNTTCSMDEDVNDMIPIAVGAALLALVAIVLVAYFVGRRRSRRLAYQSV